MIFSQCLGQELQGDQAAQLGVLGFIHHAHAAAAELLQNPVMRDGGANHRLETGNWKMETGNLNLAFLQSGAGNNGTTDN